MATAQYCLKNPIIGGQAQKIQKLDTTTTYHLGYNKRYPFKEHKRNPWVDASVIHKDKFFSKVPHSLTHDSYKTPSPTEKPSPVDAIVKQTYDQIKSFVSPDKNLGVGDSTNHDHFVPKPLPRLVDQGPRYWVHHKRTTGDSQSNGAGFYAGGTTDTQHSEYSAKFTEKGNAKAKNMRPENLHFNNIIVGGSNFGKDGFRGDPEVRTSLHRSSYHNIPVDHSAICQFGAEIARKQKMTSIPQGDADKCVHIETSQQSSYQDPSSVARSPSGTPRYDVLSSDSSNFYKSSIQFAGPGTNNFVTTTGKDFVKHDGKAAQICIYNKNATSTPQGRLRHYATTNRSAYVMPSTEFYPSPEERTDHHSTTTASHVNFGGKDSYPTNSSTNNAFYAYKSENRAHVVSPPKDSYDMSMYKSYIPAEKSVMASSYNKAASEGRSVIDQTMAMLEKRSNWTLSAKLPPSYTTTHKESFSSPWITKNQN